MKIRLKIIIDLAKRLTEGQIKEIIKCGKDPSYFFNRYCKIQHPIKGAIPFKTYQKVLNVQKQLKTQKLHRKYMKMN